MFGTACELKRAVASDITHGSKPPKDAIILGRLLLKAYFIILNICIDTEDSGPVMPGYTILHRKSVIA